MKLHERKCWAEYFQAVLERRKPFEMRAGEYVFSVGDLLVLREWEPVAETYTGRVVGAPIAFVLQGAEAWGLRPGFVVLGLDAVAVDRMVACGECGAWVFVGSRGRKFCDPVCKRRWHTKRHAERQRAGGGA